MSQWRRIAIEAIPSCTQVVASSESPSKLWLALYDGLNSIYPVEEATKQQIYSFALHCQKSGQPKVLAEQVWLFFEHAVGGYIVGHPNIRADLPRFLSSEEFQQWVHGFKLQGYFPDEKLAEATKLFHAAKQRITFRCS